MINFYEQIQRNRRTTWLIMFLFTVFVVLSGFILGKALGSPLSFIGFALVFSGLSSVFSYYYSDKMVLALSSAKRLAPKKYPLIHSICENLSLASGLPLPKLFVINDSAMNAFATGRDPKHAALCVTSGLAEKLDRSELEGVIGHEFSHIQNYDTRLMSVVTIMVGVITLLADWFIRASYWGRLRDDREERSSLSTLIGFLAIFLALLSPIIAQLIKLAISRKREFLADASSAKLTRFPAGLASALAKLSKDREPLEAANKATAHLYIVNPLKNRRDAIGWFASLFSTHPPIEERIKVLRSM